MTIADIQRILSAKIIAGGEFLEREVGTACGSDLMSDVLAYVKKQSVLLTGLCNPQAVRTAEMMDMICIVFVRGKRPDPSIIDLSEERSIVLLSTEHTLFTACGLLYEGGLRGGRGAPL